MSKIIRIPKGWIGSKEKDGRVIYYAEINYLGKRYKHKGSPNLVTVEQWLDRKRDYIKELIDSKNLRQSQLLLNKKEVSIVSREPLRRVYDYTGSITSWTSHEKGKEKKRYCAEVQCRGRKIRKCGNNKELLQQWLDDVVAGLNKICKEYKEKIGHNYEQYIEEERRLIQREREDVDSYLSGFGLKITNETDRQDGIKHKNYKGTFTYILQDGSSSVFKIGKTKNLSQRLQSFCNPAYHYRYIHLGDIEKSLHGLLMHKRLEGEWFELTEEDLLKLSEYYVLINCESIS